MRTWTLGASRNTSHLFWFREFYFKIISTLLPSAHLHIYISYCKILAASDNLLILLWNISIWIKCVCFLNAESWDNAQQVGDWLLYHQITLPLTHLQNNQYQSSILKIKTAWQCGLAESEWMVWKWSIDELVLIKAADKKRLDFQFGHTKRQT